MNVISWALATAAILGVIGFVVGLLGTIIPMPNSNLAPLIGFVYGAIGAVIGAIVGTVIGFARRARR
jgi:hypothetical protein